MGVDFSATAQELAAGLVARVDIPVKKARKHCRHIGAALKARSLTPAEAGKMVGRWDHASAVALGRSDRAFTWPLREFARGSRCSALSPVLQAALTGFRTFLDAAGSMDVRRAGHICRSTALVFVDAARRGDGYRVGGIAWGPGWCVWFSEDILPHRTNRILWAALNGINEAEACSPHGH